MTELKPDYTVLANIKSKKHYRLMKTYFQSMILPKYGGVFLDTDYVCLKPLDELVYRYSFFAHLEPANDWNP